MSEKNNSVCSICGKEYYACLSCANNMKLHPYKSFTDTAEHFKVFQVVRGLSTGVYTKDEAKEKLKNVDLSDIESFRPHIRDIIKDVLKEKTMEQVIETESVVSEKIETVEETVVPITTSSRKKKYKVEIE